MREPETPADEVARVRALRTLGILDTPPEERFDRLTRLARRLFGVPIALVSLVDSDRQWFKSRDGIDRSQSPREASFCGHAILDDGVFLVPDAAADDRFKDNPLVAQEPNIRFYAGCPLTVADGSKVGTLCIIDREPRKFDAEDAELLRDLARMVERELTAIELATVDELTGLANRRGFMVLAEHSIELCRRHGKRASLFYFDLDRFKQINDEFGHAEGDRALASFARLLRETCRDSDVIGRLGGDEFAVLASDVDPAFETAILDRLQRAVSRHNRASGRGHRLRYSVGAAHLDRNRHAGLEELMAEADAAMYEHKQESRARSSAN